MDEKVDMAEALSLNDSNVSSIKTAIGMVMIDGGTKTIGHLGGENNWESSQVSIQYTGQ